MKDGGGVETRSLLNPNAAHPAFSGGQYSLVRFVLGLLLFLDLFTRQAPRMYGMVAFSDDVSWVVRLFPNVFTFVDFAAWPVAVCLFAALLSILLAIGWYDRFAAVCIWYVLVCMQLINPDLGRMSIPFIGWLLVVHVLMPALPYGSFGARGRADPRGRWYMPMPLYLSAWYLLALAYASWGVEHVTLPYWRSGMQLADLLRSESFVRYEAIARWAQTMPDVFFQIAAWTICLVELAFPLLVLSRRLRPIAWSWTMVVHQAILFSMVLGQTSIGMVVLHLICFDPTWVRPRHSGRGTVFYDGHCGVCHGLVRFILVEDMAARFRFAPLGSVAYDRAVAGDLLIDRRIDSLVVRTEDGRVMVQSTAISHILHELGGIWAVFADLLIIIPRPLRDAVYRLLASVRRYVARKPAAACPVVPDDLRGRFLNGANTPAPGTPPAPGAQ